MSLLSRTHVTLILAGIAGGAGAEWAFGHGWWLNSVEGIRAVGTALAVMACVVKASRRRPDAEASALVSLWAGVVAGLSIALVTVIMRDGGGSLFPIVIAIGAVLAGYATAGGWFVGLGLRRAYLARFGNAGAR